jgi:hypothetical protein
MLTAHALGDIFPGGWTVPNVPTIDYGSMPSSATAETPTRGKPIYLVVAGVCAVLGVGLSIHLLRKMDR